MTDETWLRQGLADLAERDAPPAGFGERVTGVRTRGARRRRRRNAWAAAAAVAAVALVVPAGVVVTDRLDRSSNVAGETITGDAVPGDFTCDAPRAVGDATDGALPAGAVALRMCSLAAGPGTEPDATPVALPPDALVSDVEAVLALVDGETVPVGTTPRMCLNDGSRLWSMAVQYADGSVRTIEGDNGFCRDVVVGDTIYVGAGPEVYGAFIAALAEQRAVGTPPADLVASPPACERDPDDPFGPTAVMPATPPLGDLLVEPRLCWQDADRSWHGTPLSADDVAVVDADIAARLSDHEDVDAPFGDECPPWREAAIAGVSRWGEPVWIGGSCATFQWSDGRGGVYSWTPSPDVLERLLQLTSTQVAPR